MKNDILPGVQTCMGRTLEASSVPMWLYEKESRASWCLVEYMSWGKRTSVCSQAILILAEINSCLWCDLAILLLTIITQPVLCALCMQWYAAYADVCQFLTPQDFWVEV